MVCTNKTADVWDLSTQHIGLFCFETDTVNCHDFRKQQPVSVTHLISIQEFFSPVFQDVFFALQETDTWRHMRFD